ncbi:MAG: DUF362 domain-containing protein [Anaerolineae bacterium]|nr:DUF362 domain-containing protein [Anaerolineae bacterium]
MSEKNHTDDTVTARRISRRRFLELAGAAAAGLLISSCVPRAPEATSGEAGVDLTEAVPTTVPPTPTAEAEVAAPAVVPQPAAPTGLSSKVAIATARDYDRDMIYNTVRDMLDDLGGLGDVVRPGDRVALKTNLTGGLGNDGPPGYSPMESFVTHPEVVRALAALVRDAGAKEVFIVEAVYQWGSYTQWGYEEIAEDVGATLIDLNRPDPYDDFVDAVVPGGGEMYDSYIFNPILQEVDAFMSVAKMKCHWVAGVTHSMKNLFGLVPARFYQLSPQHSHRSEFHGPSDETAGQRVPRIIVELNKTRPVDFALIDGILTTEGGEGPWIQGFGAITPGVLLAGKDPVATDAVATACQGFDPAGPGMAAPYVRGLNHIALAAEAGLGTNRLDEIEVLGAQVNDVVTKFKPCLG